KAAEERSVALRRTLSLSPTSPLPARKLAYHCQVPIIGPNQVPGMPVEHIEQLLMIDSWGWSAVTVPVGDWSLIICNTSHPPDRFESDVMHELSHLLCGHKAARIVDIDGLPFPLREFNSDQEDEAIWHAGCLQIPRPALLWALRRGMDNESIADHFGASEHLVRYRRNVTGVDRQIASAARYRRNRTGQST
ncbi:MAG TPA: ImmA/IrrE family metallo-endopeptidase, partial [Thermomicrobiales bacterium]|nr:ImmA/IrrE family metallo-endopeptidase [Thermomicrobiales bacterium]